MLRTFTSGKSQHNTNTIKTHKSPPWKNGGLFCALLRYIFFGRWRLITKSQAGGGDPPPPLTTECVAKKRMWCRKNTKLDIMTIVRNFYRGRSGGWLGLYTVGKFAIASVQDNVPVLAKGSKPFPKCSRMALTAEKLALYNSTKLTRALVRRFTFG